MLCEASNTNRILVVGFGFACSFVPWAKSVQERRRRRTRDEGRRTKDEGRGTWDVGRGKWEELNAPRSEKVGCAFFLVVSKGLI